MLFASYVHVRTCKSVVTQSRRRIENDYCLNNNQPVLGSDKSALCTLLQLSKSL
jgi:hypothetical protein